MSKTSCLKPNLKCMNKILQTRFHQKFNFDHLFSLQTASRQQKSLIYTEQIISK